MHVLIYAHVLLLVFYKCFYDVVYWWCCLIQFLVMYVVIDLSMYACMRVCIHVCVDASVCVSINLFACLYYWFKFFLCMCDILFMYWSSYLSIHFSLMHPGTYLVLVYVCLYVFMLLFLYLCLYFCVLHVVIE